MDMILSRYPGLFGLSGNVEDRRPGQGSPYGAVIPPLPDWMINHTAQPYPTINGAPTYQPMNEFSPHMLPSQMSSQNIGLNQGQISPRNERYDPSWFTPTQGPSPIQNMNPSGVYQQNPALPPIQQPPTQVPNPPSQGPLPPGMPPGYPSPAAGDHSFSTGQPAPNDAASIAALMDRFGGTFRGAAMPGGGGFRMP